MSEPTIAQALELYFAAKTKAAELREEASALELAWRTKDDEARKADQEAKRREATILLAAEREARARLEAKRAI